MSKFETVTLSRDNIKIVATQTVKDGIKEEGFTYAIFEDGHLGATGSTRFSPYSKSIPSEDLFEYIKSYMKREY